MSVWNSSPDNTLGPTGTDINDSCSYSTLTQTADLVADAVFGLQSTQSVVGRRSSLESLSWLFSRIRLSHNSSIRYRDLNVRVVDQISAGSRHRIYADAVGTNVGCDGP